MDEVTKKLLLQEWKKGKRESDTLSKLDLSVERQITDSLDRVVLKLQKRLRE